MICGVRTSRTSAVTWVDDADVDAATGDVVVVDVGGETVIAAVVVAARQIAEVEPGAQSRGRIIKVATEDDVREAGRRAARALHVGEWAAEAARRLGVGSVADLWLAADGAVANLVLEATDNGGADADGRIRAVAMELAAQIGVPVAIYQREEDGSERPASGAAAGLPPEGTAWAVATSEPPGVRDVRAAMAEPPTAAAFIARHCPPVERTRGRARPR